MPLQRFALFVVKGWIMLITLLSVLACSDTEKKKPAGVIPESQLKALEKARGVEDELKKQHEDLRKTLNEE